MWSDAPVQLAERDWCALSVCWADRPWQRLRAAISAMKRWQQGCVMSCVGFKVLVSDYLQQQPTPIFLFISSLG